MNPPPPNTIHYQRCQFVAQLPVACRYTTSHYWLAPQTEGAWRVGFTKFAVRLLGEPVELTFQIAPGDVISPGQTLGSIEGFKAVVELHAVVSGRLAAINPRLHESLDLLQSDPFGEGWLYSVHGTPQPETLDVHGYSAALDRIIDAMNKEA